MISVEQVAGEAGVAWDIPANAAASRDPRWSPNAARLGQIMETMEGAELRRCVTATSPISSADKADRPGPGLLAFRLSECLLIPNDIPALTFVLSLELVGTACS